MSDRREFYAETVEEAVRKASIALGIPQDQIDFEVLDKGSAGFLGIGARDARIALVEHGSVPRDEDEHPTEPEAGGEIMPKDEEKAQAVQPGRDSNDEPDEALQELVLAVDEFMTSLVDTMGLDATVDTYDAGDVITVDVSTEETGLFIGQKGETIDAIQYLLNVAIYKRRPFLKRIVVDSEGYRQRRVEAIQGMAYRTARRVLREKRPLSLPPMSAAERRVVHLYLKENPGVTTSSDGKEKERRVIVSPV